MDDHDILNLMADIEARRDSIRESLRRVEQCRAVIRTIFALMVASLLLARLLP